jgi:hypothetical protein
LPERGRGTENRAQNQRLPNFGVETRMDGLGVAYGKQVPFDFGQGRLSFHEG